MRQAVDGYDSLLFRGPAVCALKQQETVRVLE